mgnify:CR=1 FL=1
MGIDMEDKLTIYQCGYQKTPPDHKYGPAVRNHFLIHYAVSGCGTYTVGGTTYALQAGQGFLIEPFVTTVYKADHDDPWEYYWFGFYGGEAAALLAEAGMKSPELTFHSPLKQTERVLAEMNRISLSGNADRCGLLSLLYRFFSIHNKNLSQMQQRLLRLGPDRNTYISEAVNYIEQNYNYHITVSDIARHVGLDRSYLYRLFLSDTGISPQQYLIEYRLTAACRMLSANRHNITEIAYSCGFSSVAYFFAAFKKKYGASPLRYKNQM